MSCSFLCSCKCYSRAREVMAIERCNISQKPSRWHFTRPNSFGPRSLSLFCPLFSRAHSSESEQFSFRATFLPSLSSHAVSLVIHLATSLHYFLASAKALCLPKLQVHFDWPHLENLHNSIQLINPFLSHNRVKWFTSLLQRHFNNTFILQ